MGRLPGHPGSPCVIHRAGRRLHGREVIEVEIGHRDGRALLFERAERPPAKTAHLPLVKPTPS